MERNGKYSCGKKTRHIDKQYFIIDDRIDKKGVSIDYCPVENIIGYFLAFTRFTILKVSK